MLLTDFEYLKNSEDAFRKKIALQIKTLRKQNHVSQERFFSETNLNIARLESGKIDIRIDIRAGRILDLHAILLCGRSPLET